jgi:hypothetical protein
MYGKEHTSSGFKPNTDPPNRKAIEIKRATALFIFFFFDKSD